MTFMVLAFDRPGQESLNRRKMFRQDHLKLGKELYEAGKWLYAAGILNEKGEPIGSLIIVNFASRQKLEEEWLSREPYLLGQVWEKVDIYPVQLAPFLTQEENIV